MHWVEACIPQGTFSHIYNQGACSCKSDTDQAGVKFLSLIRFFLKKKKTCACARTHIYTHTLATGREPLLRIPGKGGSSPSSRLFSIISSAQPLELEKQTRGTRRTLFSQLFVQKTSFYFFQPLMYFRVSSLFRRFFFSFCHFVWTVTSSRRPRVGEESACVVSFLRPPTHTHTRFLSWPGLMFRANTHTCTARGR